MIVKKDFDRKRIVLLFPFFILLIGMGILADGIFLLFFVLVGERQSGKNIIRLQGKVEVLEDSFLADIFQNRSNTIPRDRSNARNDD